MLDETESRMLAASPVAQFGPGMLADAAGMAALDAWARTVATRVDGVYIAFDLDCLDGAGGWALTMPEPDGLSLTTAMRRSGDRSPRRSRSSGSGATAVNLANGDVAGDGRGHRRAGRGRARRRRTVTGA